MASLRTGETWEIEGDAGRRAVWPCNYGQTGGEAEAEREWTRGDGVGRSARNPIILVGPPLVCLYNYPVALLRWGPDLEAPVPIRRPVRHFVRSVLGHNADIIT